MALLNQSLHITAMKFAGSRSIFGTVAAGEFNRSAVEARASGGRMTPDDLVEKYQHAPDPPALAGLGGEDWASVSHAHGPATDFPPLLRAAVGDDPDDRDFAFQLLFETVWHQGTVWEATARSVPYLNRALEADETPDKQSVAHLLATIADCQTGADEHMAASRRAVGDRLNLLYPYLRDPEPEVRRSVAVAIGYYPEVVGRLLPDLEAVLRDEPDEYVRAALRGIIERAEPLPEVQHQEENPPPQASS